MTDGEFEEFLRTAVNESKNIPTNVQHKLLDEIGYPKTNERLFITYAHAGYTTPPPETVAMLGNGKISTYKPESYEVQAPSGIYVRLELTT